MSLTDRLDGSSRRIDALLDTMTRREAERWKAEEAERDRADAAKARADSERCRQVGARLSRERADDNGRSSSSRQPRDYLRAGPV
jgi:hypothetical protein